MIIFQEVISATVGKYVIQPGANNALVSFDFHNDSLYNCSLNFGQDVGYQNAEYYLAPHGILTGVKAPSGISIGSAWFTGQIYLYVETPIGGTVNTGAAPASQFTALGYAAGAIPASTVAMSRMAGVSNTVDTNVTNALAITNDGYPAGNIIVFGRPAGDVDSQGATNLTNNGVLNLGNSHNDGELAILNTALSEAFYQADAIQLNTNSGIIFNVDNTGALTCANNKTEITFGAGNETHIINLAGSDIVFQSPAGTEVARIVNNGSVEARSGGNTTAALTPNGVQADTILPFSGDSMSLNDQSGTAQLRINANGVNILNTLLLPHDGTLHLSGVSMSTGLVSLTTTSSSFNHNLGTTPDVVILQVNGTSSSSVTTKVDYTTLTATTFNAVASVACTAKAIAFKF